MSTLVTMSGGALISYCLARAVLKAGGQPRTTYIITNQLRTLASSSSFGIGSLVHSRKLLTRLTLMTLPCAKLRGRRVRVKAEGCGSRLKQWLLVRGVGLGDVEKKKAQTIRVGAR